jgi:hypothetical protein
VYLESGSNLTNAAVCMMVCIISFVCKQETVGFEAQPVRWLHVPVGHQTVTTATQTQNAETQTPLLVRHKESAV